MKTVKLSIIVPIYNAEKYLHKCLESILSQDFTEYEIILVDDGSTDDSYKICEYYAEKNDKIRLFHKLNDGVSSARNIGIVEAYGEYLGFVDSDDFIHPHMFKDLYEAAIKFNADVVECGYSIIEINSKKTMKFPLENSVIVGEYECSYNYLTLRNTTNFSCNKLYKRSLLHNVRFPDKKYSEDFMFNVLVFSNCKTKVTIEGCYYYYNKNLESACNQPFRINRFDGIEAGEEMYKYHELFFSSLCPLLALYIVEYSMSIYLKCYYSTDTNKIQYCHDIKRKFKQYIFKMKGKAINEIKYSKRLLLILVFTMNSKLYCTIMKILKRI